MTTRFGIAAVQMAPIPWDPAATAAKMRTVAEQVARSFPWVDMLVFHELAVMGLTQFSPPEDGRNPLDSAQPVPGPLTEELAATAAATGLWVVPGSLWERDGDRVFNTALAISPEGELVARYRKIYPWLPHEAHMGTGSDLCVFDVPGVGRFGLCICYDSWFPEVVRNLAWLGAEVILRPTMTPTSDRPQELVLSQSHAIFNQCYVIDVNGIGPWGGGRSLIVDPDGRILQEAGQAETILTEALDLDRVRWTREHGTLGLCRTWQQFRSTPMAWPMYHDACGCDPVVGSTPIGHLRSGGIADTLPDGVPVGTADGHRRA
jgi:formamidase